MNEAKIGEKHQWGLHRIPKLSALNAENAYFRRDPPVVDMGRILYETRWSAFLFFRIQSGNKYGADRYACRMVLRHAGIWHIWRWAQLT